ncbi:MULTISPECIES: ParB/RepB/Spo0J family partition protein [Burkholderia]|uniref:ParB/RepB/Spo0J family partition protein n=2 Tax=Burkholderia cepacia complex TaxID=87882 RepID=A0AAP1V594_9BURK|nr:MULTISPECIES: ParB/RepB/Spo0J family partition protein [Burkholderia]MBK1902166.1 ParB/RepB/Spo0J family partition protein [Burkholderia contaminans]MBK1910449.1 ParB/RepB/Spo0J family partition protein [Burkholderia contaminans]MBK1923908.1 ParB/RepB/Spo0J family partition protein [Burkholderia contaminans]MBK1932120.1 ParB/RepB/Spo0J family partition protein [Burkholderia contaminans]MBK1939369.1 ParB/RepB/Spo0J family partition protein [Burkholderia contaminans]
MSKNPLAAKMKESMNRSAQTPGPESVSAIEAPLALRDRFARAEDLAASPIPRPALVAARDELGPIQMPDDTEWSVEYQRWCVENRYTPGATIEVNLSQIKPSPFNPRHFYLPRRLEDLVASIAENGQQQPIHVVPDYENPGQFFLHDGGRRERALRTLRHAKAKAIVVDVPVGIQSYKLGYELNTRRENQSPFDNAVKWTYLLENKHFSSQKELAETLGQDESIVSQTLAIGKLPEDVMREMLENQERFPVRIAYEVSKFYQDVDGDVETTLSLIERIVRQEMSVRKVVEYRSAYKTSRREGGAAAATRRPRQRPGPTPPQLNGHAVSGAFAGAEGGVTGSATSSGEEFVWPGGKIRAVLSEHVGGLVVDVQGESGEELEGLVQAVRHLMQTMSRQR